jgi:4,5-DOPA dioxygenase extradiol
MNRQPTLFLSHGSPMQAVDPGAAGLAWQALGRQLARPDAIVVASAHWETALPLVTGSARPETIHDFGGFPRELYAIRYAAPGAPALAEDVIALLRNAGLTGGIDGVRGLDHGVWVPLRWMYPDADIPVVELAVQPSRGTAHHLELGRALASLRERNVLVIGSGHTTHNLREFFVERAGGNAAPAGYAGAFAQWVRERLETHDDAALVDYRRRAPEAARAHPTEEHFLPLFVARGAAGPTPRVETLVEAFEGGSLALHSWRFD